MITYQLRYFGFDQDIPEVAEALDLPGMSFEEAIFLVEEAADPDKIVCVTITDEAYWATVANTDHLVTLDLVSVELLHEAPDRPAIHIADRAGTLPTL